jgi:hypothetical protein
METCQSAAMNALSDYIGKLDADKGFAGQKAIYFRHFENSLKSR